MKRKLFCLLTLLLAVCSGVWADETVVSSAVTWTVQSGSQKGTVTSSLHPGSPAESSPCDGLYFSSLHKSGYLKIEKGGTSQCHFNIPANTSGKLVVSFASSSTSSSTFYVKLGSSELYSKESTSKDTQSSGEITVNNTSASIATVNFSAATKDHYIYSIAWTPDGGGGSALSVTNPTSAEYVKGATATALSVTPSGGTTPYSYAWYSCDNAEKTNESKVADTETYTPSTTTSGTFYYFCKVTDSAATPAETESDVATITVRNAATPTFSPEAGDVVSGTSVTASCSDGGTIYYTITTDGSEPADPNNESIDQSVTPIPAITVSGTKIKAIAYVNGYPSAIASATYTIVVPTCATPTFTIGSYNYTEEGYAITPACKTAGATLTYTIAGGEPQSCTAGTPFYAKKGALVVTAAKDGYNNASSDAVTLNAAPAASSPETTISWQTTTDNYDKNKDHVYKSITVPASGISGINGSAGLKLTTSNNSNKITLTVNSGYVVTDFSFNAYSNSTEKTETLTDIKFDGVTPGDFEDVVFPVSSVTAGATYSKNGVNAKETIVLSFDGSNDSHYQLRGSFTVSYKLASALNLEEESATIFVGENTTISATGGIGTLSYVSDNDAIATVTSDGVVTGRAAGTANITVSDEGDATHIAGSKVFTVTVKIHENTTTENVAGGSASVVMSWADRDNMKESGKYNAATKTGIASFDDSSSNGGFQEASSVSFTIDETDYPAIKISGGRRFTFQAADGVEITSVVAYVTSHNESEAKMQYYTGSTANDIPDGGYVSKGNTPTQINLTSYVLDDNYDGFGFSGQSRVVFKVTYSVPAHMNVTIKDTGYATLWAPYAVTIPSGVDAYTGALSGDRFILNPVTTTIPAETAVILHTETPGTYSFEQASDVDAIGGNALKGQATDKAVSSGEVYTLGLGSVSNTVGMRRYTGTTVRAYSAYMDAPSGEAHFYELDFGGETTSIKGVEAQMFMQNNKFYNLNGQEVQNPTKGLYVVNGKKVVIK